VTENVEAPAYNTVAWWEIPVQNLEKAKPFYSAVFGWTFQPFGEGYDGVFAGDAMIGALSESAEEVADGVRLYLNVADIEATLETAAANGGAVSTPRQEIGGDMGWWAHFRDSQGRLIGVHSTNPAS
jgi:predicted enzyme related to lactoylglutathione lyase